MVKIITEIEILINKYEARLCILRKDYDYHNDKNWTNSQVRSAGEITQAVKELETLKRLKVIVEQGE